MKITRITTKSAAILIFCAVSFGSLFSAFAAEQVSQAEMRELFTYCSPLDMFVYVQGGEDAGLTKELVETSIRSRLRGAGSTSLAAPSTGFSGLISWLVLTVYGRSLTQFGLKNTKRT